MIFNLRRLTRMLLEKDKSYRPVIELIKEEYEIPQLGRTRRIAALMPHNYAEVDTRYPVLYLHDGQNLYNKDAPFGNWGADIALETLAKEGFGDIIVIAIDHGDEERVTEYSPYFNPRFGEGEGGLYLEFLTETLKPFVDQHFRTKPERMYTGVGGSSMGGLISLAAGIRYPEVFGKMLIFSPSLWINPQIFGEVSVFKSQEPTDLYIYAGGKESNNHLSNIRRLKSSFMRNNSYNPQFHYQLSITPEGNHSEHYWGKELPIALRWLFRGEE